MEPLAHPPKRFVVKEPWGQFEELTTNQPSTVKILTVEAGQEISLQAHDHRSEWWIVLDDAMDVVVGDQQFTVHKDDEVFVPAGTKHRAIGLDKACRWLEISFGDFDEQDITRYDDMYGRA